MKYNWNLSELKEIKSNWYNVFSCFSCWGGSSMWYKYAWYKILWTCEIDKQMNKVYQSNFGKAFNFEMWVQEFKNIPNDKIPPELFDIDILDWSPPCSTFSTAWSREKARWKDKVFREWQAKQVLSDLFFDYLDVAEKLRPKIIIAENVSGMLKWNAQGYVKMILKRLDEMWYVTQLFLLNGATMWLPQKRERVFFISRRKDIELPKLNLNFNEKPILFWEFEEWHLEKFEKITNCDLIHWAKCVPWDSIASVHPKWHRFNSIKLSKNKVANTIASWSSIYHPDQARQISLKEMSCIGSRPMDYKFEWVQPQYLIWMSVPPVMMFKISEQIKIQRLDKIKSKK